MRVENWERLLNEYIEQNNNKPFKYGRWDCCIFTAGAVKVMTGENYIKEFKYTNKKKAEELIEQSGGIMKILTDRFGEPQNPNLARRGDIIYHNEAIGICLGAKAIFLTLNGFLFVPMNEWLYSWRV
jgi:hypothetical protein